MQRKLYTIGIDFGTLLARASLIEASTGQEVAISVYGYPDAVIDQYLPDSTIPLPPDTALQNPQDYLDALYSLLKDLGEKTSPDQIIGIGVNFTSCTVLAVDKDMKPLCFYDTYRNNPHSWAKLWKHHSAQAEAGRINALAHDKQMRFIKKYGGKSSSEWIFAKILETVHKAPLIYEAASYFIEAGDWIVYQLTNQLSKSNCFAGYKAFWDPENGYPSGEFWEQLNPMLHNVIEEKLSGSLYAPGVRAGGLQPEVAAATGLAEGTSVSVASIDAHVSVPAAGIDSAGKMLMIMGTSLCHMVMSDREVLIDGISGVVKDGILPGYYGYEAGQAAVGDIYDWFVSNLMPYESEGNISDLRINEYDYMNAQIAQIKPGSSGLLALDWWNGNRSTLADSELSGLILGLSLTTKPEEIYRALVESTAFGTRMIIDNFEAHGVRIDELIACGGLSRKAPQIMQIFADVLGTEIKVCATAQTSALGAAMNAAVAASASRGGYDTIQDAIRHMTKPPQQIYKPDMENHIIYNKLYEQYCTLYHLFGQGPCDVMKALRSIRAESV